MTIPAQCELFLSRSVHPCRTSDPGFKIGPIHLSETCHNFSGQVKCPYMVIRRTSLFFVYNLRLGLLKSRKDADVKIKLKMLGELLTCQTGNMLLTMCTTSTKLLCCQQIRTPGALTSLVGMALSSPSRQL